MTSHEHLFTLVITGSLMLILFSVGFTSLLFLFRQRSRQHATMLRAKELHWERVLLKTRVEVQEQALELVSMEVHDNIGQVLGMVRMLLLNALRVHTNRSEMESLVAESASLLHKSINDLRSLSHIYSGKVVGEAGLVEALAKEFRYIRSLYKIECHFSHPPEEDMPLLTENQILLLFRIVQESMQNTVKHSDAKDAWCKIEVTTRQLRLNIRDNGKGVALENIPAGNGMGLTSIRERAVLLNGEIKIVSAPGKGFEIGVCVFI